MDNRPLGIFDSGIGGLTVARALRELLPRERLIYLGDTARVPYGNKSPGTVIRYAREIARFLLSRDVKGIIVACNTASAYALDTLQAELPVPVFGVIAPGVSAALAATRNNRIGIIGTTGTINSRAYQQALRARRPGLALTARAAPLLVPLIEEGWLRHPATRAVLAEYTGRFRQARVDTLVLACTHYPLLKELLTELLGDAVTLVDSAETCARQVRAALTRADQLRATPRRTPLEMCLTDQSAHFKAVGERFLREQLRQVKVVAF
ncbi:MAG: glutamate racemase [Verrucomicrobiales bacterium]|jgi:glutamate racemase|nr:glutamate racemase [Verrucomicrobiales bacterium]